MLPIFKVQNRMNGMKMHKILMWLLLIAGLSLWVYYWLQSPHFEVRMSVNGSTFTFKVNNCTMNLHTSMVADLSFQGIDHPPAGVLARVYVYSAFYETRTRPKVVVVAMVEGDPGRLFCLLVLAQNQSRLVAATATAIPENENRRYTASLVTCVTEAAPPPLYVSVIGPACSEPGNLLRVVPVPARAPSDRIAVCVPPINSGYDNLDQLVEFISVNEALGAAHFFLYEQSAGPRVSRLLATLSHQGNLTLVPFRPPMAPSDIKYFGQMAAIQDCLYRTMGHYRHVAFTDLDEYLVPRRHRHWHALIAEKPSLGAYLFRNAWFPTDWPQDPSEKVDLTSKQLRATSLLRLRRAKKINRAFERSKLIVDPLRISVMGIHNVWRFILGGDYQILTPEEGLNQHYRNGSGFNHKDGVRDDSMLRMEKPILAILRRNRRLLEETVGL